MENKGLKIIGTAVVVAGLMGGAFLAGGLTSGDSKSGAEPELEPTAVVEAVEDEDTDEDIVLVGDEQDETEDEEAQAPETSQAVEETESTQNTGNQDQGPVAPPPAPVEPTPAPPVVEPTPAPPTPEPTPVNEAPYVVSISPEDDAIGVALEASIVVTFSEPMDKATAQAALNLSTGNCGAFAWNGDATEMTFTPCGAFAYGDEVEVEIYDSASDLLGLGMDDEFDSEFRVLRQSTLQLRSEDAYDGNVFGPGIFILGSKAVSEGQYFGVGTWVRGFLSFDLSDLPEDLVEIQSATVNVKQSSHQAGAYTGGSLLIESVTYGSLTSDDWGMAPNTLPCPFIFCLTPIVSMDAADGWKSVEMAGYVRADWEHREDRDYNSQFRLRFLNDCGDGSCPSVSAQFVSGQGNGVSRPYLYITYTHP
jgi:hypothetical protein